MQYEVQPGGCRGSIQFISEIETLKTGDYQVRVKFDKSVNRCWNLRYLFNKLCIFMWDLIM